MAIACTSDKLWTRLAMAMRRDDLAASEEYAVFAQRAARRGALDEIVGAWTARHSRDEVLAACESFDVPCGPLYGIDEICADPQYADRGTLLGLEDPRLGTVTVPNVVVRLSETPGRVDALGPDLGAHNKEVLCGRLGLAEAELEALIAGDHL